MNVSLTRELEQLVDRKVKSGRYQTASEVIREALRLLEERDQLAALRLASLRKDIRMGLRSGKPVPLDLADLTHEVRKRMKTAKTK